MCPYKRQGTWLVPHPTPIFLLTHHPPLQLLMLKGQDLASVSLIILNPSRPTNPPAPLPPPVDAATSTPPSAAAPTDILSSPKVLPHALLLHLLVLPPPPSPHLLLPLLPPLPLPSSLPSERAITGQSVVKPAGWSCGK